MHLDFLKTSRNGRLNGIPNYRQTASTGVCNTILYCRYSMEPGRLSQLRFGDGRNSGSIIYYVSDLILHIFSRFSIR